MADKKHNFTRTEIMAGAMVVVSALVLAGFIATIQGFRPPEEVKKYYAYFDNTGGLDLNAEVRFGGYLAGTVTDIRPAPENETQIRVEAAVRPDIRVNEDSVATVEQIGLTAAKHLEISTGDLDAAVLADGATMQSVTKSGGLVELPDLGGVITRVETLLDDIMDVLGAEEARQREEKGEADFVRLTEVAAQVNKTLQEGTGLVTDVRGVVKEQGPNVEAILLKVQDIEDAANELVSELNGILKENREPVRQGIADTQAVLADVRGLVDGLQTELETLMGSLQATLDNADTLSGDVQELVEANRPRIEDILFDVQETVRNLKTFSRVMAEQPQAIIRGREPQGRRE